MGKDSQGFDLAIIVHKSESRLLLTDRNGFYNDVLTELTEVTQRKPLLILTHNKKPLKDDQLINDEIDTLANQGDQPTLLEYKD